MELTREIKEFLLDQGADLYIFVQLAGRRCGMCIASCPVSNGKK